MGRPKGCEFGRIPKHTAFLSIITSRKEMIQDFVKFFPQGFYFKS
jgi:hypothetical protein